MKMGTPGEESLKDSARSNGREETYLGPITDLTNVDRALDMRSGRSARKSRSFSKSSIFFQSPGMGSSSGRSSSIHSRQRFADPTRSSGRLPKPSRSRRDCTHSQLLVPTHSGTGLSTPTTRGPRSNQSNCCVGSLSCFFKIAMVNCEATISLCLSNNPEAMYWNTVALTQSMRASTRFNTGSGASVRSASGTKDWSVPPGHTSIPFFMM
mmetsp:Transcript_21858/g.35401  ORF Transcript_21858/g.35401 Transcript_21858/m.35401 type:complete len:210 (+) Transcript_21858:2657-3286(+)